MDPGKRLTLAFAIAAVAIAVWPLRINGQSSTAEPITDPDAYAVFGAVLNHYFPLTAKSQPKTILLLRETTTRLWCEPSGITSPEWIEVLKGFRREYESPRLILPRQPVGRPYTVLSRADLKLSFPDWGRFYARHRKPSQESTEVSAPAFNATKTKAIVYAGHTCGPLCGRGQYWFMEKQNGAWNEANLRTLGDGSSVGFCAWIS